MKPLLYPLLALLTLLTGCQTPTPATPEARATTSSTTPAAAADADDYRRYFPADGKFPGRGEISGWDAFPRHNAKRRALFASRAAQDRDGLVFVGDSITEGWHTQQQDLADLGVKIVNRGIGGDTTPNLLYRLEEDVLSLRPRALVLLIGTNDLAQGTSPADIAANLKDIHARIRAQYPQIPLALCLVMPRGDGDPFLKTVPELNAHIRALAASDPKAVVVDTYTPLAAADGKDNPAHFTPDHLHLNPSGYAQWRDVIKPVLRSWKL